MWSVVADELAAEWTKGIDVGEGDRVGWFGKAIFKNRIDVIIGGDVEIAREEKIVFWIFINFIFGRVAVIAVNGSDLRITSKHRNNLYGNKYI